MFGITIQSQNEADGSFKFMNHHADYLRLSSHKLKELLKGCSWRESDTLELEPCLEGRSLGVLPYHFFLALVLSSNCTFLSC